MRSRWRLTASAWPSFTNASAVRSPKDGNGCEWYQAKACPGDRVQKRTQLMISTRSRNRAWVVGEATRVDFETASRETKRTSQFGAGDVQQVSQAVVRSGIGQERCIGHCRLILCLNPGFYVGRRHRKAGRG
jgi:hypothetical protein